MANGLFLDPAVVQQMQRAQTASLAPGQANDILRGSLFNLGQAGAQATTRGFGGDSRSPLEKRQAGMQQILQGMDFRDPNSIMDRMNQLNDAGFQNEAFKLMEALPAPVKPQKSVVAEWTQDETVGDTTKRFLFQRDNLGFITRVGEVSDKFTPTKHFTGDQEWQRDVQFDQDSRGTFLGRIQNRPEFKSLVDDTDPEQFGQFTGLIAKVANDLKDEHRRVLAQSDPTRVPQQMQFPPNDDFYLDEAYNRFVAAGGVEANIDRGFNIAGADVKLDPDRNTTDPATLSRRIEQQDKKARALEAVAARTGQLVVGDPRKGQFTLRGVEPQQMQSVFSRLDQKSDEQIQAELEAQGFQFTDRLLESHAPRWQLMREQPQITAKFINLLDNRDLFQAERVNLLEQLDDANNFQAFASAQEILKYIERVAPKKKKKRGGGPSAAGRK